MATHSSRLLLRQQGQFDNILHAVAGKLNLASQGEELASVRRVRQPGSRQEVGVAVLVEDKLGAAVRVRRRAIGNRRLRLRTTNVPNYYDTLGSRNASGWIGQYSLFRSFISFLSPLRVRG